MIGMVLGSVGTPFWPWHTAHACAFASMSSAAHAGKTASAKPTPTPKIAEKRPANIVTFLPTSDGARRPVQSAHPRVVLQSIQQIQRRSPWIGLVTPAKRSQDTASLDGHGMILRELQGNQNKFSLGRPRCAAN